MLKGKVTTLLSESLVQVMFGSGKPSAVQLSVTVSVSLTVMLPEMLMLGGSVSQLKEQNECDHEYVIIIEKTDILENTKNYFFSLMKFFVCMDYYNWSGITGLNHLKCYYC